MVRWFVLASVLLLSSGTVIVASTNDPLNALQRVVQQLLGVRHLRVEVAHDVQSVDCDRIGAVSLILRDKVQEFTGSSNGLNLLL